MTLLQVLQSTTGYFTKRKIQSPRLNAEHLLAHVLGRKRIELYLEFERVLTEPELAPLRELVRRRADGEPLQHLLGTVEFCGRTFLCDKRALVPRPETEELVEVLIADIGNWKPESILDVGTGSGVIALSLAAKFPEAEVHATDISEEALSLARENAERLGLTNRITFARSDLPTRFARHLNPLPQGEEDPAAAAGPAERRPLYDLIVANLPYVAAADRETLSREVLHDPATALFGGERGDELIRQLIEAAPGHLRPGGMLVLEVGAGQAEELARFAAEKKFHEIVTRRDFAGVIRFLFARYG
jgi:release factor glutamine methyltransferase